MLNNFGDQNENSLKIWKLFENKFGPQRRCEYKCRTFRRFNNDHGKLK